jgi:hypothetical protein
LEIICALASFAHFCWEIFIEILPSVSTIQVKNFWLNKIQTDQKSILEAYFSDNLINAIDILQKILKTKKNLLELSFTEL